MPTRGKTRADKAGAALRCSRCGTATIAGSTAATTNGTTIPVRIRDIGSAAITITGITTRRRGTGSITATTGMDTTPPRSTAASRASGFRGPSGSVLSASSANHYTAPDLNPGAA